MAPRRYNIFEANPACADADADAFASHYGITDATEKTALCELVTSMKNTGWQGNGGTGTLWSRCDYLHPFSPTSLAAAAGNLKTPGFKELTFASSPTHTSNGVEFNGVDQYFETQINPNIELAGSGHLTIWSQNKSTQPDDSFINIWGSRGGSNFFRYLQQYRPSTSTDRDLINMFNNAAGSQNISPRQQLDAVKSVYVDTNLNNNYDVEKSNIVQWARSGSVPNYRIFGAAYNFNGGAALFGVGRWTFFAYFNDAPVKADSDNMTDIINTYNSAVITGGR